MNYFEKTLSKKEIFKGNIINIEQLTVELPNGKIATRDMVVHPGASVVIPISSSNEIYMVRQYRTPIGQESLEAPAGKIDAGENPYDCAKRELKEETGLDAEKIEHIISVHSTPGFSNEVLHIFIAMDLSEGNSCADPDEFISCEKYTIKQLIDMIYSHKITDAKTIIGIFLAERQMNKQ
ncbi:MAG: NUDIX hydrolase [Eubacteriales bacterium]|nr:NUDIX hydrolase [Eubacteriales bacterium]